MNYKNKTVLFVMPRLPFLASSGRKTSLYHYCRIISQDLGYRLVVAAFVEDGDDPNLKPDFIDKLVILPKASALKRIADIVKDSLVLKKKPMQVSLYWSVEAKKIIDELVHKEQPEIIIGDMVRSTEYIKDKEAFTISDLDDRISLRYKRQLEADIDGINPYGAFLNTMPLFIRKIMLIKPIKLYVVKSEIDLLTEYELLMGKVCDSTVFVAESEAENFNKELGENRAVAVPIGVDVEYFFYRETGKEDNYVGFLGAMSVAHNENAAKNFIKNIFPHILEKVPNAKFMVIGGGVSENLKILSSENIIFTGRVDDVRDYLQKCKVFVCPMIFGSGIKTKNLEAMALGLPVITTTIGIENINAVSGVDCIVADENIDFSNAVIELLLNDSKRNEIGKNGSKFINKKFTWEAAKNSWERLLKRNAEEQ